MSFLSFAVGLAMPNYPLYVEVLGASASEFGILLFLKTAALVTIMVPGGWLADRVGPKPAILMAGVAETGGWLILSMAPTWHWVALYSVLSGTARGVATGGWYIILANENPTPDGTPNTSAFALAIFSHLLPDALGSLAGIGFFKHLGDVYTLPILSTTFKLGTICNFAALCIYSLIHQSDSKEREESKIHGYTTFFTKTHVGFLGFLVVTLFIGVGTGMIFDFMPLYFVKRFQVTPSINSLIRFLVSFLMAGGTLAAPSIGNKLGNVTTVIWGQLFMIPPIIILAREQNRLWLAVTAYLLREILLHTIYPILTSVIMNVLAKENRGKGGSLFELFWNCGYLIAPPISGQWIQTQGFGRSFYMSAVCAGLSTFTFHVVEKQESSNPRANEI